MIADPKRPRSLSLDAAERKAVRDAAAAAGKPISQYVLDLAAADDPDRHPVVLTPGEQAELRDGLREVRGFLREDEGGARWERARYGRGAPAAAGGSGDGEAAAADPEAEGQRPSLDLGAERRMGRRCAPGPTAPACRSRAT